MSAVPMPHFGAAIAAIARALLLTAVLVCSSRAQAACEHLLPGNAPGNATKRAITAEDIVRIRDIGFPDAAQPDVPSPLAVSPDGERVAFIISRADPVLNRYCRGLVLLPLRAGASPVLLDRGGDYISQKIPVRNLFVTMGIPKTVTPVWSPDGTAILFLRRERGSTQLWRVRMDGRPAEQLTRAAFDIEAVAWPADSPTALVSGRPGAAIQRTAIEQEGLSGWLYDERVATNAGPKPQIRADKAPLEIFAITANGHLQPATTRQRDLFNQERDRWSGQATTAPNGRRAWEKSTGSSILSPKQLWATSKRKPIRCDADACSGNLMGMWWNADGTVLTFLRREGWDKEATALYRWRVGASAPQRVLLTTDVIQDCVPADEDLLCTREDSITPRHLVIMNRKTGAIRTLFDPNPEFRSIALGSVTRLKWRNKHGFEAWGDLVLPPHVRPGTKLPMIVVQYHSRGFLRGGTNNDYPIFLFAAQGFAVLSLERPTFVASLHPELESLEALNRVNYEGWAEHASLLSSLKAGVAAALATGKIDPSHLGITGLSDGATVTRYALINTDLFAAAAISTCCLEPKTVMTYGGIAWAEFNRRMGFPPATQDDPAFWAAMSLTQNAAQMDTPLLMQLADDEYILALEAFEALREHEQPVEMYVFPNEHHGKWQPAHRLAIYERDVDWFAFWLQGREDAAPEKRDQYRRWEGIRAKLARSRQNLASHASTSTSRMIRK